MSKEEATKLILYLTKIQDRIPRGLSSLKEVVNSSIIDLGMYRTFGEKNRDFDKAVKFARSIPEFEDLNSEEFINWKFEDREHLNYLKKQP